MQVLTGRFPFNYNTVHERTHAIISGVRPGKPENAEAIGLSAALWKLVQECWSEERARRPTVHVIVDIVRDAAARWHVHVPPSSPHSGGDRPPSQSDETPGEHIGMVGFCPSLSDYQDTISRRGRIGAALDPHISKVVVPKPITGKSCRSVVRSEVLTPQRDSRKGRRTLARVGGVANREPLDNPNRARNGYGILSGEIQIANINPIRLWNDITSTDDEGKAIRTLAKILVDKEGRKFIANLGRKDAELCIEILDHVSRDPCQLPLLLSHTASSGHHRTQPQNGRETGFLRYVEEACCNPWATTRFHDDNRTS